MDHTTSHSNVQSNNIPMIASTLITTVLMEKYKFQPMYYGMLHGLLLSVIPSFLAYQNYLPDFHSLNTQYIWYILPLIIIILICYKFKNYYKGEYLTINIYSNLYIQTFEKYIAFHEDYYPQDTNSEFGNIDAMLEVKLNTGTTYNNNMLFKQLDHKIEFDDKFLNIKGYYTWKQKIKTQTDKDKNIIRDVSTNYIELNILKTNKKLYPKQLFADMTQYNEDHSNVHTILCYYKILAQKDDKNKIVPYTHSIIFHNDKKESLEVMENKYIKTLFHPKRDELWDLIKNNILNLDFYKERGQIGRISILLYGPPGTGKSTFAYRIAMCLFREIVSLDLRILKKPDLYRILNTPGAITGGSYDYKANIYLFEEFDISIKYLYYKQKNNNKNRKKYLDIIENMYTKKLPDKEDKEDKEDKKETITTDEENFINCDRDEFTLRDLLEIFQGPIPFESMIMLASTNKYEDIKTLCPELFRPGRLTPVYFGYIDKQTLQEISLYFFKKKLTYYLPNEIKIPTSEIIELALKAQQQTQKQFEYFSNKLNKLLDEKVDN